MSANPSAFDALKLGARAAAAHQKNPQPSKKRKKSNSKPSKNRSKSSTIATSEAASKKSASVSTQPEPENPMIGSTLSDAKKKFDQLNDESREVAKRRIRDLRKKPAEFDPRTVAWWEDGERVPFLYLCLAFDLMSNEQGGSNASKDVLCNMLRTVMNTTPDDLVSVVYLSACKVAPAYEGVELGIGEALIIKALAKACGGTEVHIKNQYQVEGDLGLVAKGCRCSQSVICKPAALTVARVFDTFRIIAKESGKESQTKKINHIKSLLVAATDCEPLYLIRMLQAKLRIGLGEQTLLSALGQAALYNENHSKPPPSVSSQTKEAAERVKQVYSVIPVYDKIIAALLRDGIWNLEKTCSMEIGIPMGPMLAKQTNGVHEIIEKFQGKLYTCEYKYDGERAQIHYMENGSVEIYSRSAERNTEKYPDVSAVVSRLKKPSVTSFILDCEIVAYDRVTKKILSFQTLSSRARKNVVMNHIKVDVCIYAFDILFCNGQSLLKEQLVVRRQHLYESFEEEPGYFQFATSMNSNILEEIQGFFDAAVNDSCEGLIIKTLDTEATYEPSKRSNNWLKLKKDYIHGVGDSLDLIPIGAFYGRGARTGVYGSFLLACYDPDNEEFQSVCNIGSGLSDEDREKRSAVLRSKVIPNPKSYYRCGEKIKPDVWFKPTEVWEIKAADLTLSPDHQAAVGIVHPAKGISLRLPRLVRFREDKNPEQATSSLQVADMFRAQKQNYAQNNQEQWVDD